MKRKLIFNGFVGRWDTPSFLLTENEPLTVELSASKDLVGKHILTAVCGDFTASYAYDGQELTFPAEVLQGNALELFLQLRTVEGDRVIIPSAFTPIEKGYFIEPLKLIKVDGLVSAIGWLTDIENRQKKIEEEQAKINARLDEFTSDGVPLDFEV